MASAKTIKSTLDQKLKNVRETPAGFTYFVSLHDFVQYVESTPLFDVFFSSAKRSRNAEIPKKYFILKQIYQGIEDIDAHNTKDLGHDRYAAIRDLGLIRKQDFSENNSFWKNRESMRKLVGDIHKTLSVYLSE